MIIYISSRVPAAPIAIPVVWAGETETEANVSTDAEPNVAHAYRAEFSIVSSVATSQDGGRRRTVVAVAVEWMAARTENCLILNGLSCEGRRIPICP
jgi:hypothetical protein